MAEQATALLELAREAGLKDILDTAREALDSHLLNHDKHTLVACVTCFIAGSMYRSVMRPKTSELTEQIATLFEQCGKGPLGKSEHEFVEGKLVEIEMDVVQKLPGSIAARSKESAKWFKVAVAVFVLQSLVIVYLHVTMGMGLPFYLAAALPSPVVALSFRRSIKARRAADHFAKLKRRIENPRVRGSGVGVKAAKTIFSATTKATTGTASYVASSLRKRCSRPNSREANGAAGEDGEAARPVGEGKGTSSEAPLSEAPAEAATSAAPVVAASAADAGAAAEELVVKAAKADEAVLEEASLAAAAAEEPIVQETLAETAAEEAVVEEASLDAAAEEPMVQEAAPAETAADEAVVEAAPAQEAAADEAAVTEPATELASNEAAAEEPTPVATIASTAPTEDPAEQPTERPAVAAPAEADTMEAPTQEKQAKKSKRKKNKS